MWVGANFLMSDINKAGTLKRARRVGRDEVLPFMRAGFAALLLTPLSLKADVIAVCDLSTASLPILRRLKLVLT